MTTTHLTTDEPAPADPPVRTSWRSGWQVAVSLTVFELVLILLRTVTGRGAFNQEQVIQSIGAGNSAFGTLLNPNTATAMLWAGATVLILFLAIQQLAGNTLVTGTLVLVFVVSPLAWDAFRPGSPFATTVLAGTALFVVTRAAMTGRCSPLWLLPLGAVAVLLNTTHVIGVIAMALFAGISLLPWFRQFPGRTRWSAVLSAGSLMVGALAALAIVKVVFRGAAQGGAEAPADTLARLRQAGMSLQGGVLSLTSASASSPDYPLDPALAIPLGWVCIAGLAAATALYLTDRRWSAMTVALVVAAVVAAPVTASVLSRLTGIHYGVSGMATATLVPMFLLVSALVARNRMVNLVILAYSGILAVSLLLWSVVPA